MEEVVNAGEAQYGHMFATWFQVEKRPVLFIVCDLDNVHETHAKNPNLIRTAADSTFIQFHL
jgi:hypothetical protein